jgi:TonB family protein
VDIPLDLVLRSSLIVFAALVAAAVLRRRSAALRHWVLAIGIACGAAVPVLQLALPSWSVPHLVGAPERPANTEVAVVTEIRLPGMATPVPVAGVGVGPRFAASHPGSFPLRSLLAGAWLAGAMASLSLLVVGMRRVARIAAAARPVLPGRLTAIASEIERELGLGRPVVLLESADATTPMTWGAARPRIVLPASARGWSEERARLVLRHELAHVARGDWLFQMLAEVVRAGWWFNPVYWIACSRLRAESERACDDTVLNSGIRAVDYASHLLEIARGATPRPPRPVIAMARGSSLEGRISAMLNASISRRPLRHAARLATLAAFAAVTVPLAVAQVHVSSFTGIVLDQTDRRIPGAEVVLSDTSNRARYEITTDSAGSFEFVALPGGDYELSVQLPGFKTHKEKMTVAGKDISRTFQLQIGSLQETVVVTSGSGVPSEPNREALEKRRQFAERVRQTAERCAAVTPTDPASGSTAIVVGGSIIPPIKVTDVKPVYTEALEAAGIAGPVSVEAVIGIDGRVRDVTVVSSPHPELERAAADAVQQWEFTPTYLNCIPVEVSIRVTVTFAVR